MFYVFCLFTPLYRRFRLSRVSQRIDLDEIYRLVSKILNFTPCGSVFGRFCIFYCKNRFPKNKFAIEPCRREVLGRPVARYSAVFVFLSCARVLCAGLVRFSCAPKANYSTKHRNRSAARVFLCLLRDASKSPPKVTSLSLASPCQDASDQHVAFPSIKWSSSKAVGPQP